MKSFLLSIKISFLFLFLSATFVSCNKTNKKNKQTLRVNIVSEPGTLDPLKARALNDINLIKMFQEGLTREKENSLVELSLCKSYDLSEDKKIYTFHLRDAEWSNGKKITAQDFLYAWKKALDPNFPSGLANLLYCIQNAEEIKKGKLDSDALQVFAKNDQTLEVHLKTPTPYFLSLLANPIFFPRSENLDKKNPTWFEKPQTYLSSGPFLLKTWNHNYQIDAVKNPKYWDQNSVKMETIQLSMVDETTGFQMFQNKELDIEGSPFSTLALDVLESIKQAGLMQKVSIAGSKFLRTNVKKGALQSKFFRKALALSINREEINHQLFKGLFPANTGLVPKSFGLQTKPYFQDHDIVKAKELFDEFLKENKYEELAISYVNNNRSHRLAQLLQDQIRQALGIKIALKSLESKIFFQNIKNKDYDLAISSWQADFGDPVNFLEVFRNDKCSTNNTNWENVDYEKLLQNSYLQTDDLKRNKLLARSEALLIDEMPIIPLSEYNLAYVKQDNVKDLVFTNTAGVDFKWAFLDKEENAQTMR